MSLWLSKSALYRYSLKLTKNMRELSTLSNSDLTRFTDGFRIPIYRIMHYNSTRSGLQLDWNTIGLSSRSSDDLISQFTHYEEAIPCLSNLDFSGASVLVLGSSVPWLECFLATRDAREILTVEYRAIRWHPDFPRTEWSSLTFDEFMNSAPYPRFDRLISYSSVEHSGLGRYGDAIDPEGDLISLLTASRWLTPDARVYLALPVGPDAVLFNRHRVYGNKRLKLIARVLQTPNVRVVPPVPGALADVPAECWSIDYAVRQPAPADRPVYDRQLLLEFLR